MNCYCVCGRGVMITYIYIYILNKPYRVDWFKSLKVTISLANTLEGENTQTIASKFKSHEVTSIFSVSVVSGAWHWIFYIKEWRWWISNQFALLGYCIPCEFLPVGREQIPFFWEETQPWTISYVIQVRPSQRLYKSCTKSLTHSLTLR